MALSAQHLLVLFPATKKETQIDLLALKKAEIIIKSLNHKLRLQIIRLLQEKNELAVTEIFQMLRIEQSVASQHLAILRRANIVNTRREGKFIFYSIDPDRIIQIYTIAKTLF